MAELTIALGIGAAVVLVAVIAVRVSVRRVAVPAGQDVRVVRVVQHRVGEPNSPEVCGPQVGVCHVDQVDVCLLQTRPA